MRASSGFSLLEVLVAMAICGATFVVLLSGFSAGLRGTGIADGYTQASLLARSVVAEIESTGVSGAPTEGTFGEEFPGFSWSTEVVELPGERSLVAYQVDLHVRFRRGGQEREVLVRTVLVDWPQADR